MNNRINNDKKMIECMLFSYQEKSYLVPVVAVAEVGMLGEYHSQKSDFLASLIWRGFSLPLLTPGMDGSDKIPKQAKFAIINALFSNKSLPPYFALLIDKHPSRLKVRPEDFTWIDAVQKRAKSNTIEDSKEVTLLDIAHLSQKVEKLISNPG